MSLAKRIRDHVVQTRIQPAHGCSSIEIQLRSGAIHEELQLSNRLPAVCGAIDAAMFGEENGLALVSRTGPRHGASVIWRFALVPKRGPSPAGFTVDSTDADSPWVDGEDRSSLEEMRWRIIAAVRHREASVSFEALGERVRKLAESGAIPYVTARQIFVLLHLRNRVVYDGRALGDLERAQLGDAWTAIRRWLVLQRSAA